MQFTKDSFYIALQQRMQSLYPNQTVTLNGVTRPAIIVVENEPVVPVIPLPEAFYIEWGIAEPVTRASGNRMLYGIECLITHHTFGSSESGVDRGRQLSALDTELMNICQPQWTSKRDYTQSPSVDLGTNIFWTEPVFGKVVGSQTPTQEGVARNTQGVRLERTVRMRVFFYPEVNVI